MLPAGATIYITVSTGPDEDTVVMPYLVGMDQYTAERTLESLGLSLVSVSMVYNRAIPYGCVVSQNVDGGSEIPVGSKIYLQISLGPETTAVPAETVP
jgi:beta-lactam-binding protein with PASTA domain